MPDSTAIDELLRSSLRLIRDGQPAPWPVDSNDDWSTLDTWKAAWSRIEYHGIAVLLHEAHQLLEGWPERLLAKIGEEARLMGLWEATHRAALEKLLDRFGSAEIEHVLMKGTAIAYSHYDDPAARRRGDSDLLIRPSQLDEARRILSDLGWHRSDDPHGLTFQEGWIWECAGAFEHALDLHWAPAERPVLQKTLPIEEMFSMRQPLPGLCKTAWRAGSPHLIIHEAMNQSWHEAHGYLTDQGRVKGARRLIWSIDFSLLTQSMSEEDWEQLIKLCDQHKIGPLIANVIQRAAEDLGTPVPSSHLQTLQQQSQDPEILDYFATKDSLEVFWFNLRHAHSWKERWQMLSSRGFPPVAHLRAKYPDKAGWPRMLLQGWLMIETGGRVLRRIVAR